MSALNIKDPQVAAMARKLAKLTGKSITDAVAEAVSEGLAKASSGADAAKAARERRVDEIVRSFQSKRLPGGRSLREINDEMYDEFGLPR